MGQTILWDRGLDNPANFLLDLSTNEASEGTGSSKTKKPKTKYKMDPTSPPTKYTKYAYEVCFKWYEIQTLKDLEKKYLRHTKTSGETLKKDLEELIKKKCKESSNFDDME